jgi:hypothetical protein
MRLFLFSTKTIPLCLRFNHATRLTHLIPKQIGRLSCKFRNYKYLLQVSCDGQWVDGREFPPLLDSFATILKAKRSGPLDRTLYKYLDAVHMDITFGD